MMDILSPLVLNPLSTSLISESSDGFFQIFSTGLFHGFFFSLPFSIPMLICFRRYLLDGFSLGNYAFAGTLLGHLSFVFCTVKGIRPIIHFWYPFEPLLSLLGLALSLKLATDFFSQRRFIFDGTLGSAEASSAYAMNPWPKMPEISWQNLTGSPLPRPIEHFFDTVSFGWSKFIDFVFPWRFFPEPIRLIFQKLQNFCETNLGPSIFSFQFFLMWLNPASASTLNLLFFEHDLLMGIFVSPNSPIFLSYTFGFIIAASSFSGLLLFALSQLSGRSFFSTPLTSSSGFKTSGGSEGPGQQSWLTGRSNWFENFVSFDEALAQKRLKILNKFFTFLILGCLIQSGLNYSWRLFLQYPLEMIHWDLFDSQKLFSTLKRSTSLISNLRISESGGEFPSTSFTAANEVGYGAPKEPFQKRELGQRKKADSGSSVPLLGPDEMRLASSAFMANSDSNETYWADIEKNQDFALSTRPKVQLTAMPQDSVGGRGFFGRREFPPYDTSIRNREKNLPVERHLAIERVNSRRALMGRPPLENEERENAIFKYHTFFINQIDRSVEDFKMKLVTPKDLYREEDDILALKKLHENYLKQKGRESAYQKSFLPKKPNRKSTELTTPTARHDRDFFTKSRPVKNTTKGLLKSSYIRDLFDENLREASRAYLHDDLLLENIMAINGVDK